MTEPGAGRQEREPAGEVFGIYITNRWSRRLVQPLLIIIQVVSLFAGVVAVSRAFETDTPWMSLIWLFIIVSAEGIQTTFWLDSPERRTIDRLAYRAAEVVFILLLVRIFTWTVGGQLPQFNLFRSYLLSPLQLFGDRFFLIGSVLTILAWLRAIGLTDVFAQLAIDQAEASYYTTPAGDRIPGNRPLQTDRSELVGILLQQWILGAVTLIIFTALSTFKLSDISMSGSLRSVGRLGLASDVLTILTVYFLSGLMLMSQARLAAMNARWLLGGAAKSGGVERRWNRSTLWLVLIIALAASFLPIGSTTAIGHIVETLLLGVLSVFNFIFLLILALFAFLFQRASPPDISGSQTATPVVTPLAQGSDLPQAQPDFLLPMLLSSMFWAVAIVVTVMAVRYFLRGRGQRPDRSMAKSIWLVLKRWLRDLRQAFSRRAHTVRRSIQRARLPQLPTIKRPAAPDWRPLRVNRLSPRRQLRYYYLSTVKRAEASGVKRGSSETPLEYSEELRDYWPESGEEVEALTEAFLAARYSDRDIGPETAADIKVMWQRLKSAIGRRSSGKPDI